MSIPEPHADEQTIEIDADKYKLWLEARAAVKAWQVEAERLADDLKQSLYGFSAGTINGQKVVSNRAKDQYAVARLVKDYPDLTEHYMKPEFVTTLDVRAFANAHPEVAEKYRVREFRSLEP